MGKYRVLGAVTFSDGKNIVMYRKPKEVVDIDDNIAKRLGNKVEKYGGEPAAKPSAEPTADQQAARAAHTGKAAEK